ncbi:MAG: tetratricopeptide repeat protein, partial [Caldilineae bacterium]
MTTLLQQAIDLAQAGQRDAAEELLRRVLAEQPDNEVAWMWLSAVTRDVLAKQEALRRALKINPNNELARRGLQRFGGAPPEAEPAPPVAETPPAVTDFDFDFVEETPAIEAEEPAGGKDVLSELLPGLDADAV